MNHTEISGKLGEILIQCNATWYDDPVTLIRHIKGNFTEEDKKEFLRICGIYSPLYPIPEIVFD